MYLEVYPQVLALSTVKVCKACGELKPRTREFFHVHRANPDGFHSECRQCRNKTNKRQKVMPTARDGYKYCPRCEREFPATLEYFYSDKTRQGGLSSSCRDCARLYSREYRENHPEMRGVFQKKWRAANPEKTKELKAASQKRNRAAANERVRQFYKRNPEKRLEGVHARRARILGNGGRYTTADVEAIRKAQTDKRGRVRCWVCGKPMPSNDQTIDHFVPLSRGGSNDAGNIRLAHMLCNQSKGSKHPHELGRLI